jgi:glycosyltransferase involved in cell wall biosynthesis
MMSERHWPEWVPLANRRVRDEWIELERSVYRNAAYVFPWSEFARRSMIEDYGVAPERAIATGVGANLSLDRIDPAKDYGSQTALFVGYEFERKGGRVLVRAWERVRRALPRAELIVVGPRTPPPEDVPGIRWVRRMPREELERLYRKATLFVMPSLFEPWGHVFLEAMGFGLPCIGTDTCAMPEIVQRDRTGLLVPPGDDEALADALVTLLADPERSREMGRAAHAEVVRRHTWDRVIERMSPYVLRAAGRDVAVPKREPVGCVNEVNSAR